MVKLGTTLLARVLQQMLVLLALLVLVLLIGLGIVLYPSSSFPVTSIDPSIQAPIPSQPSTRVAHE